MTLMSYYVYGIYIYIIWLIARDAPDNTYNILHYLGTLASVPISMLAAFTAGGLDRLPG